MPILTNTGATGSIEIGSDLGYQYPLKNDWRPGRQNHDNMVAWLTAMGNESKDAVSKRDHKMNRIDQSLSSYIQAKDGYDEPDYIIVPQSAATLDTILTHWITTFDNGPLIQFRPVGPEDKQAAMLAEIVLDVQLQKSKALLAFHTQFRDSIAYGLGVVHPRWEVKYGKKIQKRELSFFSEMFNIELPKQGGRAVRDIVPGVTFEGNVIDNIDYWSYFPDPNCACHEVQKFKYAMWLERTNYEDLLRREKDDPETWFNVRYLEKNASHYSSMRRNRGRKDIDHRTDTHTGSFSNPVDVLNAYVWLIPKDKKLGNSPYPELWVFGIAGDSLLIRAQPVALAHGMIPLGVAAPTYDGYSIGPASLLELVFMLQEKTNEIYSAHMHNLINAISNRLIVDPWIVNYADVISNKPGSPIKIREHMWGRGVQNAVEQIKLNDVTGNFMGDIANNNDLMQRITGAVDSLQGIVRPSGERRSATEMRDTRLSALSRLQKQVRVVSMQSMSDVGKMCLSHTQQFMSEEVLIEIVGRHKAELEGIYGASHASVDPLDILGEFDVLQSDGSMPGSEFVEDKLNIYREIKSDPIAYQMFDGVRMLLDVMRSSGIKDPTSMLKPQFRLAIMPDEMALNIAQQQMAQPGQNGPIGASGANGVPGSPSPLGGSNGTGGLGSIVGGAASLS